VALLLPDLRGALYLALLSVLWVAEWPLAFQMMEGQTWFLAWLIIVRTLVLIALIVEFAAGLFFPVTHYLSRIARYVMVACWLTVPIVSVAAISSYRQARVAADPAAPAITLVREQKHDAAPVIFADTKLYRRLYAAARSLGEVLLLPGNKHVPEDVRVKWLDDLMQQGLFWLIADEGTPDTGEENRQAEKWVIDHACPIDSTSAGAGRVMRFTAAPSSTLQPSDAVFNDELAVSQFRLTPGALATRQTRVPRNQLEHAENSRGRLHRLRPHR